MEATPTSATASPTTGATLPQTPARAFTDSNVTHRQGQTTPSTSITKAHMRSMFYETHLEKSLKRIQEVDDQQRIKHPHETWSQIYFEGAPRNVQTQFFRDIENRKIEEVLDTLDSNHDCLHWRDGETNPLGKSCSTGEDVITNAFLDVIETDATYLGEVNGRDIRGRTPIFHCCCQGNLGVIKRLLNLGAEVNLLDGHRWGPLAYVASHGHVELFRFFLEKVDVDLHTLYEVYYNKHKGTYRDSRKQILHILAKCRDASQQDAAAAMAAALLAVDASTLEMPTSTGKTALHDACAHSNAKLVQILLQHGAKVNCRESSRRTPLHVSMTETRSWSGVLTPQSLDCIRLLLQSPDLDTSVGDCYGATPLMRATMVGDVRAVKLMVEAGFDFRAVDPKGRRLPAHFAAREQHAEVLDYLLSLDATQANTVQWIDYGTPLLTLLSQCNARNAHINLEAIFDCVCVTLRHGTDATLQNAFEKSGVDLALPKKLWRTIRILILAGDEFNKKDFADAVDDAIMFLKRRENNQHEAENRPQPESDFEDDVDPFLGYVDDEDPNEQLPFTNHDNWSTDPDAHFPTLQDLDSFLWCQDFLYDRPLALMELARICIRRQVGKRLPVLCTRRKILGVPLRVLNYILLHDEIG